MVFFIVLAVICAILLFVAIRCALSRSFLKSVKEDSLIICGRKGKGKTKLMSEMTRMDSKTGYLSNIDFKHKNGSIIDIKDISLYPNTYKNFLDGEIIQIKKKEGFEGKPIYIDDAGVYLPNYADSELKKKYPSLPIAYALWRHGYNAPIHMNCQTFERPWKLLREQADGFILCRKTWKFPLGFQFVSCTYYSKASSCEQELRPLNPLLFNKFSKAGVQEYRATNGVIKNMLIFSPTWRNKYDSRVFHKKLFGYEAPRKKSRCRKSPQHSPAKERSDTLITKASAD